MNFWQTLGKFGQDLLGGIGGAVSGIGQQFQSTAAYNMSIAELNQAQADALVLQVANEEEERKRRAKERLYIITGVFGLSFLFIIALLIVKYKK